MRNYRTGLLPQVRRRNVDSGTISKKEAEDLLQTVGEFKIEVVRWLKRNHPLIYS
jgi:hypothetical protein